MLKLYVVIRVYMLMRKGWRIDALRLVRARLGAWYGMSSLVAAKRFTEDVSNWRWPRT